MSLAQEQRYQKYCFPRDQWTLPACVAGVEGEEKGKKDQRAKRVSVRGGPFSRGRFDSLPPDIE